MRMLHAVFLFRSVKVFFPPLVWNESFLDYESSAYCSNDQLPRITAMDWLDVLVPETEINVKDISIPKMPTVIFQGVPLKAARLAMKAFLAFRKIDIPGN